MLEADVVVIGGGPAGLSAAVSAARSGASVVLLDEYADLGGQFFRREAAAFALPPARQSSERGRGDALRAAVSGTPAIQVINRALVWSIVEARTVMVYHAGRSEAVRGQALVLATGARDRPVPFPGWTLPGVMTAGGAQALAKANWVRPGQKVVLAGSGPFLLPVAKTILASGAEIVALLEATGPGDWWPHASAVWGEWQRCAEAWQYWRMLRQARIPVLYHHRLLSAIGETHVTGARVARVDAAWQPIPGTERIIEADAVAVGFGFLPNTELAELCGCAMRWDASGEAWFVGCDLRQATSVPGLFAAGEITGIGGSDVALLEGQIAGISAAEHAAHKTPAQSTARRQALGKLRRHARFAAMLNRLFAPRPGLWDSIDDAVSVCRCEEVSCGAVRHSIQAGCASLKEVKDWTRAGMGPCQGRVCASLVSRLIATERKVPLDEILPGRVRAPIKPVPLSVLVESEDP